MSKTLRVLPLGGLGEIGKNMTVVEYDGKIVVVDTGLRFPAPDQLGIDLVLPDFTYLRERQADIEAIVLTHGHEDHVGALPFVLREFDDWPPIYGGPLTIAMVRSKLDEHKLKEVPLEEVRPGEEIDAGPFVVEPVKLAHSIPDMFAYAITLRAGHRAGHRRLQVRPDPGRRHSGRRRAAGRTGPRGHPAAVRRLHQRRPARLVAVGVLGRPPPEETFARCKGRIVVTSFASNIHRVQQVVDAADALGRKVALVGRSMKKNVNIGRQLGHIEVPEGMLVEPKQISDYPDDKLVIISTGSQGEPLSALRRMAAGRPSARGPARGRHGHLLGHADPGQRARRERDGRPAVQAGRRRDHRPRRAHPRLRATGTPRS